MKMIVAVVRQEMLGPIQDALNEKEVYLMTVSNVHGCGRQRGYTETFRGGKIVLRLIPKVKLEIAVNDDFVKVTVDTIQSIARTGKIGDGKIFVLPMDDCFRIRTGEQGTVAIGP